MVPPPFYSQIIKYVFRRLCALHRAFVIVVGGKHHVHFRHPADADCTSLAVSTDQQLGRALTAAGNFEPLVIDLVDNFEMIGIEQIVNMMSESYARLSDENDPKELIPPSAFKVIDHEKDARHLAKNLERRLALRSEKLTIDEKIALWKGL